MDLIGEERGAVTRAVAWLDATRAELVGLTVLLLGVTVATGLLVWQAFGRPDLPEVADADPSVAAAGQVGTDAADAGGYGADEHGPHGDPAGGHTDRPAPGGAVAPDAAAEVTVHIVGHVARPGVVTLPPGARVADALEAAGGATDAAELARINLARVLSDGEHVHVVAAGEEPPEPAPGGPPSEPDGGGADGTQRLDLNRASASELETLPGIGPAIAARIVEHRDRHGPFRSPGDLREVSGIGERRFQDLADRVHVG